MIPNHKRLIIIRSRFPLKLLFLVILVITSIVASGQNNLEKILDTIMINERPALLFANKRWSYLDDHQKTLSYDSLFSKNWQTKQIHAYSSEKNDPFTDKTINLLENNSAFVFPLDTFKFLRGFKSYHTGLDLKADIGDSIRAAFDGKVRFEGNIRNGYGNLVILRHFNGLETYYSHLSKILVNVDEDVSAGDIVGLVGQTGRATTHHLHFETRYRDRPIDPSKILSWQNKTLNSDSLVICSRLFDEVKSVSGIKTNDPGNCEIQYHIIVGGDTLYKISKKYNTSIDELCQLNNISKTTTLQIGKQLKVKTTIKTNN